MQMRKLIKPLVFILALLPLAMLLLRILQNNLGPDPVQELSLETGVDSALPYYCAGDDSFATDH